MILRAAQLILAHRHILEGAQFLHDEIHHLPRRLHCHARIDRQAPGVGIHTQLGEHRVGQPLFLANILEQARAHSTAQHRVQHIAGEPALVGHGNAGNTQVKVRLLQRCFMAKYQAGVRGGCGIGGGGLQRLQPVEPVAHQIHHARVFEMPGRGDQDVRRLVCTLVVIAQHAVPEIANRVLGSENGPANGMVFPEIAREDLMQEVLGIVHLHLQLFQNDALFFLDVLVAEQRVEHQIRENVEGDGHVFVQHLGVVTHHFLGGEGVEAAADGIHRPGDVFG